MKRSEVQVLLGPQNRISKITVSWGFSSVGRAPALQAGGQGFDPPNLHNDQFLQVKLGGIGLLRKNHKQINSARQPLLVSSRETKNPLHRNRPNEFHHRLGDICVFLPALRGTSPLPSCFGHLAHCCQHNWVLFDARFCVYSGYQREKTCNFFEVSDYSHTPVSHKHCYFADSCGVSRGSCHNRASYFFNNLGLYKLLFASKIHI